MTARHPSRQEIDDLADEIAKDISRTKIREDYANSPNYVMVELRGIIAWHLDRELRTWELRT